MVRKLLREDLKMSSRIRRLSMFIWGKKVKILELDEIIVNYDAVEVLHRVSINVDKASIVTLIGSNGAGKSTILKSITGLVPLRAGKIIFNGTRIEGFQTSERVKMGIALCPEGRRVFPKMTAYENLKMGGFLREWGVVKRELDWIERVFPILSERKNQLAGSLSGGEQQMLALGRSLMLNPELLLLDEPSLGLAPLIVKEIASVIRLIKNERQKTIILVEQNCRMALRLANKGYVIETGNVSLEGDSEWLLNNEIVRKSYLGG
jgi:branched-chain amino acid transport system ATP-binding protein